MNFVKAVIAYEFAALRNFVKAVIANEFAALGSLDKKRKERMERAAQRTAEEEERARKEDEAKVILE